MEDKPASPFLTPLLLTLTQRLRLASEAGLADIGLTLAQLGVLRALDARPGASNAELARLAFIAPQSMSETLTLLESRGLVVRRADSKNARVLRATLTREGKHAVKRAFEEVERAESQMLAVLSVRDQSKLRALLQQCAAADW